MKAPAALLGALCESLGVPSTARPGAGSRLTVLERNGRPGASVTIARERAAATVAFLTRQRSELATARTYRLAMEALERRRAAILEARSPRLCPACTGTRRTVDDAGTVTRCATCTGQGIIR